MYVYSYPLIGKPSSRLALVDHTHNYQLQVLLEQGIIGLIGFMTLCTMIMVSAFKVVKQYRTTNSRPSPSGVVILALFPSLIGKLFEMQSGVARVSDLLMTYALLGAVIAMYEILNTQKRDNLSSVSDRLTTVEAPTTRTPTDHVRNSGIFLTAIAVTTVIVAIFTTWDIRRLSASLTLASGHDSPSLNIRAKAWSDAQAIAPERESMTYALFEAYFSTAKEQYKLGNTNEAMRLLMAGRELLLEYERRDPLLLDAQIGLSKTASTLAEWGHNEYLNELMENNDLNWEIGTTTTI